MHLRCFDEVIEDAEYLILNDYFKENALLRAIDAAYQLQKYDRCHSYLVFLKHFFPDCPHHNVWVCRVCNRFKEQLYGKYDFTHIWKHPPTAESPLVDFASYTGPIEPRETQSWGRGVFTTQPVKAGELLLCEKALSVVMPDRSPKSGCFVVNHHETTLTTDLAAFTIRTDVVQKIVRNRSLRAYFDKLYDGGYGNSMAEGPTPYVDV